MKVQQLFENELGDLAAALLLVKHGKLTLAQAKELTAVLQNFTFIVSNKPVSVRLRWTEDKRTGTLKFISADVPGAWRSGAGAASRGRVKSLLKSYGFKICGFQSDAIMRHEHAFNAPHIFFWGPGTPPPKEENFALIPGTPQYDEKMKKFYADRRAARDKSNDAH